MESARQIKNPSEQKLKQADLSGVGLGLRLPHLRDVARGQAENKVAFLEISPENFMSRGGASSRFLANIAERHPLLTHGLMLSIGAFDPINPEYLNALAEFCKQYGGAWHSDHLCFSGHEGGLYHDLYPLPLNKATARRVASRIDQVRDKLGKPFAIENISAYFNLGRPEMPDWEFLCEVQHLSQCMLLLDVNNVYVNSINFRFDPVEWLRKIPLDKIVQLHIAGHEWWDEHNMTLDTHGAPIINDVLQLMQWVIQRTGPLPVLLERDSNIPTLDCLLEEVATVDRAYRAALKIFDYNHNKKAELSNERIDLRNR